MMHLTKLLIKGMVAPIFTAPCLLVKYEAYVNNDPPPAPVCTEYNIMSCKYNGDVCDRCADLCPMHSGLMHPARVEHL